MFEDRQELHGTGMVTYVIGMTPAIDDEILSWITPGGILRRRHGSTVESTRTERRCLLALTARPHLVDGDPGPIRLTDVLLHEQQDGGCGPYRTSDISSSHSLWSPYLFLALRRADWAE